MELRKIDNLDGRLENIQRILQSRLSDFEQVLRARSVYTDDDPEDVSIYPRIIPKNEHKDIQDICSKLTEAAFSAFSTYLENSSDIIHSHMNDYLISLPVNQRVFSGNARYDFLKEGDKFKLIEMNFVNVGALIEATESAASILELFPELSNSFYYESPTQHLKSRMEERSTKLVLLLTRDDYSAQVTDSFDRPYIKRELLPIEVRIIPEREYKDIVFSNGSIFHKGSKVDAIYPRHLDGTEGYDDVLFKREKFCRSLLESNVFIFDHLSTMLLEDKDLRFLTRAKPTVQDYLPEILDPSQVDHLLLPNYVLKLRNIHMGKGVIISPQLVDIEEAILEERIHTNKFPVFTIHGNQGDAVYDTGVYISYCYDLNMRELRTCEVAGYLTRFSLDKDIVNLSQGGGLIPTLIEK